jgi:hypothetical protein
MGGGTGRNVVAVTGEGWHGKKSVRIKDRASIGIQVKVRVGVRSQSLSDVQHLNMGMPWHPAFVHYQDQWWR